VLASGGLDQPVECVVEVLVARLDALVLEVDRLLPVVLDVGDVAGGIVGIVQVLQAAVLSLERNLRRRGCGWRRSRIVADFAESSSAPRVQVC